MTAPVKPMKPAHAVAVVQIAASVITAGVCVILVGFPVVRVAWRISHGFGLFAVCMLVLIVL